MINYPIILEFNYADKQWAVNGDSYENISWLDASPKPTQGELDALWPSTQVAVANKTVEQNRIEAYRAESDPLFFQWQRGEATEQQWKDKVAEIQARYPYEGIE
jgi:hypothetical protein